MRATSVLSSLGYAGLRATRLPSLSRRLRNGGVVLCYHNVVHGRHIPPLGDPGLHLPVERLSAQLRWLARRYTLIPLAELIARVRLGRPLRGTCALTFDDAYLGVMDHAIPLLHALGIPATLFVIGSAPGRHAPFWWDHAAVVRDQRPAARQHWLAELGGDERAILATFPPAPASSVPVEQRAAGWPSLVAASAQGMTLGAHSHTHRALTTLDDASLSWELRQGRDAIEAHTGLRPTLFAYPYGVWDRRVRSAVQAAGYDGAVTLDRGVNGPGTDPWSVRRVNVPANLSDSAFECWTAGLPF